MKNKLFASLMLFTQLCFPMLALAQSPTLQPMPTTNPTAVPDGTNLGGDGNSSDQARPVDRNNDNGTQITSFSGLITAVLQGLAEKGVPLPGALGILALSLTVGLFVGFMARNFAKTVLGVSDAAANTVGIEAGAAAAGATWIAATAATAAGWGVVAASGVGLLVGLAAGVAAVAVYAGVSALAKAMGATPKQADTAGRVAAGAAAGAVVGAAIGSVVPGVGTAVGAVVGAAVGAVAGWVSSWW